MKLSMINKSGKHIYPKFKKIFIYYYFWLHQVLIVAQELSNCDLIALQHVGS